MAGIADEPLLLPSYPLMEIALNNAKRNTQMRGELSLITNEGNGPKGERSVGGGSAIESSCASFLSFSVPILSSRIFLKNEIFLLFDGAKIFSNIFKFIYYFSSWKIFLKNRIFLLFDGA